MLKKIICFSSVLLMLPALSHADELIQLTYKKWDITYNCDKRGYESFHYTTVKDQGSLKRFKPFHQESKLPNPSFA